MVNHSLFTIGAPASKCLKLVSNHDHSPGYPGLGHTRNLMINEKLLEGKSVCYRSSGWSLWPRVHSNDQCTYTPVTSVDEVQEEDIVFCQVMPGDRFHAHLVKKKEWHYRDKFFYYTIANIKGRENVWTTIDKIYGKLVDAVH